MEVTETRVGGSAGGRSGAESRAGGDRPREQKKLETETAPGQSELRAADRRAGRGRRRRSPPKRWSSSSGSRTDGRGSRSPKPATVSARSATSACVRRCSTRCAETSHHPVRQLHADPLLRSAGGRRPLRPRLDHRLHRRRGARESRARPGTASTSSCRTASVEELHGGLGIATNNIAEYNGLLAALAWAVDHGQQRRAHQGRLGAAGQADARGIQGQERRAAAARRARAATGRSARPRHASSTSAASRTRTPTGCRTSAWTKPKKRCAIRHPAPSWPAGPGRTVLAASPSVRRQGRRVRREAPATPRHAATVDQRRGGDRDVGRRIGRT